MGDWSIESNRKGQNREVKGHKETGFRREKNNMKMRKKGHRQRKGSRRKRKRQSPKCGQTQRESERQTERGRMGKDRSQRHGTGGGGDTRTHTQK